MEFKEFRQLMQDHVETMFATDSKLYFVDVYKDVLKKLVSEL